MSRPPSLQDIADKAGVSVATASLALRDKGRISQDTRRRIKQLAEECGYVPNASARSLVGGKTRLIVISMPALGIEPGVIGSVEYFARLLSAAAAAAFERDYGLLLVSPADSPDRVAVDGGVVVDPAADDPALAAFDRRGWPVVTIGRRVSANGTSPEARMLAIDSDIRGGTERMLEHFRERGAGRVALLATNPIDSFERDSIDAYKTWCSRYGNEPRIVVSQNMEDRNVLASSREIMEKGERPDAVYATIDKLAFALLERCHERGIEVPEQMIVATCGDSEQVRNAGLTVLDDRPAELGRAAVNMLVDAIEDPAGPPVEDLVSTELIIRDSTG